ncbi:MAG: small subunit ribosomal protein S2 [Planctomycetota bacterium]|jgi:small subunit ribosomal protein S2
MFAVPIKTLLEAGVHFGHRASRWNPRMAPYIFGKRNLIHIIDLKETLRGLIKACSFLQGIASEGQTVLFVGTKRQAQSLIATEAAKIEMPYVAERWLGGILTNFTTIRSRLRRLEQLEAMESDGTFETLKKKEISRILREKQKIFRNLHGIRNMNGLPGALVVVDPRKEKTAVAEARKMGIPVIAILDTDCDPSTVDIAVPGNDDALRSLQVLLAKMTESIVNGRQAHAQFLAQEVKRKAETAQKKDQAKKNKLEGQKKKAAEQAELDKILKKSRDERERRLSEQAGQEARAEKPEAAPAPTAGEVKSSADVAETKPGPTGPESVEG